MRITDIRETTVSIRSDLRNAFIQFAEMTVSAVAIKTDVVRGGKPVTGFGFHSNGRYAQGGILRERLIPRLLKASPEMLLSEAGDNFDPHRAWQVMMANEKPGGHGDRSVAVGALDMAFWDLVGKIEDKPLYRILADRYRRGEADIEVSVYAAGGYYTPGKDIPALQEEIRRYLDLGYDTVKIKIGGATLEEDLDRIEAVLAIVGKGSQLAVDANGRFSLTQALEYGEALDPYELKWFEEPGDPLDFVDLGELSRATSTPLATGENLFSFQDSRNLIRHGGLRRERDYLQMDPTLGYGLVEYLRILDLLERHGWSARRCVPHGGHQMALHMAAGLGLGGNESYPGVFQPFGGFADGLPVQRGKVRLPDAPGVGVELKSNLYPLFQELAG